MRIPGGHQLLSQVATRFLVAGFAAARPLGAQEAGCTSAQEAVVEAGNRLEIAMFTAAGERLAEVSGTRIVDRSGRIFLPYVGSVQVQGRNVSDIREQLEERYTAFYADSGSPSRRGRSGPWSS